jgi:hypothetical protein
MPRAVSYVVGAIAILSSQAALAGDPPPANFRTPKVGEAVEVVDRLLTISCKRWVVKEVNKDGFNILQCGNNLAYFSVANSGNAVKVLTTDGETLMEFTPYVPGLSFPLELGKKWVGKYKGYTAEDGLRWSSDDTCEVKAFEPVKVAAGTLPAYRIDCEETYHVAGFSGFIHTKAWYSPETGAVVKVDNQENPKWNMEVAAFAPAK